ncbi:MAG: ABC transporter permease [Culicoidibacterales bacterium]
MIIVKTYLRLLKKNWAIVLQTLVITIGITFLIGSANEADKQQQDNLATVKVAIVNKDDQARETLIEYLATQVNIVDINFQDESEIIEKLSYNIFVKYVLVIENGSFKSYYKPGDAIGAILDQKIIQYENQNELYKLNNVANTTLNADLEKEVDVSYSNKNISANSKLESIFNLFIYGLIGSVISGIGVVTISLGRKSIKDRTRVSALKEQSFKMQLLLGHFSLALLVWAILVGLAIFMTRSSFENTYLIYYILNSFIFIFPVTALGLCICSFITKTEVLIGANNVISLGLSFISGAFVPMQFLDETVIQVAKFTPSYWFAQTNAKITGAENISMGIFVEPIIMQLLFSAFFIILTLLFSKNIVGKLLVRKSVK